MDAAVNGQNGKFAHMMKRIWNGPEEVEESAKMQSERNLGTKSNYGAQNETYGGNLSSGNRPVEPGTPKREPETTNFGAGLASSTVISKGTIITGDIKSDGDIEMYGTVTGSMSTTGKIKINGKQIGDVQGASINLTTCSVRGNISAAEDIMVDSDSVIVGDIKCGDLTFDGKLKGNVHVMGNVNCKGNAIIIGDITSTTITVDSGAKLQGKVQISDGSIEQVDLPDEMNPIKPEE
ncbi:MAG TPA: polymer-forming cytoskeletal protein [Caproicibacter sp.]|nr:polymer-forming cytoskeletal protein [Caproicibacter sp.]